jgi:hypothetical protein
MAESRRYICRTTGQTAPGIVSGNTWLGQMNPQLPWEQRRPMRPASINRTRQPCLFK